MDKINRNEFIWFGILLCFTVYLSHLLYTEKIGMFIHPRMNKYIIFACISFGILTINQFSRLFSEKSRTSTKYGYVLFLFPLILGVGINPQHLNAEVATTKGINLASIESIPVERTDTPDLPKELNEDYSEDYSITEGYKVDNNSEEVYDEIENDIALSDTTSDLLSTSTSGEETLNDSEKFMEIIGEVYGSSDDENKGKEIEITGFVYKDDSFGENQFLVGRMCITCCAADAQILGLICEYDDEIPPIDQWVEIKGVLDMTDYTDPLSGEVMPYPCIKVNVIRNIEEPSNSYVYDSFSY